MRGVSLLWALALAACAQAQEVSLDTSAAIRCLTPLAEQRGAPDFPFDAFKAEKGGRVKVKLTFNAPDRAPQVEVLEQEGDGEFVTSVKQHVGAFRVPCLGTAESPVRLTQDYVFQPDRRQVIWTHPEDLADAQRSKMLECVKHPSGQKSPDYPRRALEGDVQGRVWSRLVFEAPDRPPKVTVQSRSQARLLAREVADWVPDLRMPCHAGAPVAADWTWVFRLEGLGAFGFGDVSLRALLANIKGIERQTVAFDFTTMGCPFEVRLRYLQPYLPNQVGEFGSRNAARRPFLDWLAATELKLTDTTLDAVFADNFTLQVPCLKIDLKPKEKS